MSLSQNWEKVEEDKPKEIERKVDTHLNNKRVSNQAKLEKEYNTSYKQKTGY